ncbi:MAG: NAD(P)/FAD-dependent oxidoreductase [Phycisphaerales bacterium]|nr:NAD(P)/FAD-dependent oxidoreductase [Phycisphaerales bacterium]
MRYDTIIVGGGPAGLSAALVLGRCRRSVLVIDAGRPRNYAARNMHNYLSRDGINPRELLALGHKELEYYGVHIRRGTVTSATCEGPAQGFSVEVDGECCARSRTLLLATGVVDDLPNIPGLRDFYGLGVHHCPYCDGWEYRDQPIAAYGRGKPGLGLALSLLTWSPHITIVTDGHPLTKRELAQAFKLNLSVRPEKIRKLQSVVGDPRPDEEDHVDKVEFESGPPLHVRALFFNTDQAQRSKLPETLGCKVNEQGGVIRDKRQRTGVKGLYLAGDASRDVQFVIVAAAEGAKAGMAINSDLQIEDRATFRPKA